MAFNLKRCNTCLATKLLDYLYEVLSLCRIVCQVIYIKYISYIKNYSLKGGLQRTTTVRFGPRRSRSFPVSVNAFMTFKMNSSYNYSGLKISYNTFCKKKYSVRRIHILDRSQIFFLTLHNNRVIQ